MTLTWHCSSLGIWKIKPRQSQPHWRSTVLANRRITGVLPRVIQRIKVLSTQSECTPRISDPMGTCKRIYKVFFNSWRPSVWTRAPRVWVEYRRENLLEQSRYWIWTSQSLEQSRYWILTSQSLEQSRYWICAKRSMHSPLWRGSWLAILWQT